ncbi:MAG: glycosyltransferase [Planctomycetes bacterium]|nr:glycosyltransferase [Planctomycetota bacterium]
MEWFIFSVEVYLSNNKIKVALFWSSYVGEGTSFNELARRLDPDRFELIFISLKKLDGDPDGVDKNGHRVYYLSGDHRINALEFGILWKLVKILKSEKIDILHAHRHKPCFYASMSRCFISIPLVIAHMHGLNRTKNFKRKLLNRFMFSKLDKVIGCANKVCEDIRFGNPGLDGCKVVALENSVDYEKYSGAVADVKGIRTELGVPENAFLFLAVGRFAPTKGFKYLIKAFSEVLKDNPGCHLLIAGVGRDKVEMEELVKSLGLEDSVHMPGRRSDIPQLMKACDCFVMSSIAEGMPLTLLEAMSSGLPCLATSVGGIPELLDNDEVGKLVEPGDAGALAGAMLGYAAMGSEELEQVAESASKHVKANFSHEVLVKKLQKIYEDELSKAKVSKA